MLCPPLVGQLSRYLKAEGQLAGAGAGIKNNEKDQSTVYTSIYAYQLSLIRSHVLSLATCLVAVSGLLSPV